MRKNINFKEFIQESTEHIYTDMDVISMYFDEFNKKNIKEIAALTGKSIGEIYRTLDRNHLSSNRNKIQHHNVISLFDQGFSPEQISEFIGYSPRNIRYIIKNNTLSEG